MAEIIKARVWQKVDTEANWDANPLILGAGEQAFVVSSAGAPINFKIGDGTKRFSELPWYLDGSQGPVNFEDIVNPSLGSAAAKDVGTGPGNVVELDGNGRLPAVDGSQLTNIPSGGGGEQEVIIVTSSRILQLSDRGKCLVKTSFHGWTIPSNSSVPFPIGTEITVIIDTSPSALMPQVELGVVLVTNLPDDEEDPVLWGGSNVRLKKIGANRWYLDFSLGHPGEVE